MPGRIIALEGIDQSGKATQARLLVNHFKQTGIKVDTISFPNYTSPSGRQIRRYLKGSENYPPEALHMLYSLNRWENRNLINNLLARNDFLVADRYVPSNLAYGVAKGLNLSWLLGLDKGLPTPSLVVILDVPIHASFDRKAKNRDIHERDEKFLANVKQTYHVLARRFGWHIVNATRTAEEVHAAIWKPIAHRLLTSPRKVARSRTHSLD